MKQIIAKIFCFFGLHDWVKVKNIVVKEYDSLYLKTTTYKCATCKAAKVTITEA